jgi:hypothetical protein
MNPSNPTPRAAADTDAAGLLPEGRLNEIREQVKKYNWLDSQDLMEAEKASIDLLAHADAEADWFDERDEQLCAAFDYREAQILAALRGLVAAADKQPDRDYNEVYPLIHEAARALGLTL